MNKDGDKCPLCGGDKKAGKTTYTVDLSFGVVVVRDVPATGCSQCGADWIDSFISHGQAGYAVYRKKRLQREDPRSEFQTYGCSYAASDTAIGGRGGRRVPG